MTDPVGFSLADGFGLSGRDIEDVWWRYAANGGTADLDLFTDRVHGRCVCGADEHDLIAQTLNECFLDSGVTVFPVRYVGVPPSPAAVVAAPETGPRARATEARMRGAVAARQAALLHLTAARLMQRSGKLVYASRAQRRATDSNARFHALAAPR